jgi:carotenoid cleavage dioxygenase-like enzyme
MPLQQPGSVLGKRKRRTPDKAQHPYLAGNFAPIHSILPLTQCSYTGTIPSELIGGQYVRNGSNPVTNEDLGRDAHWFDGDGMISGVSFTKGHNGSVKPEFVNQYILTDLYITATTNPNLRRPILPSIATLVNPVSTLLRICLNIFRAILLVLLSRFPGSEKTIKKISVANTHIIYHDGRALATCESGPPMRVQLPGLETVGWFDGIRCEGEIKTDEKEAGFGGEGLLSWMKEWTTAHPKVDPESNEMMLFHSTFLAPFVHYSVIPATKDTSSAAPAPQSRLVGQAVKGISSAKMMHDFGVSSKHTVIMDLPLSLDPLQLAKNKAPIVYDPSKPSRFGIFPRREPSNVRWFETSACCIFHTVNTWDVTNQAGELHSVDMLACRMTSASLVFSAGNIAAPEMTGIQVAVPETATRPSLSHSYSYEKGPALESPSYERDHFSWASETQALMPASAIEDDQCRLYYYSFLMPPFTSNRNTILHQYSLSTLTFEFPSVAPSRSMRSARYVYGCTTTIGSFNTALGKAAKIDAAVKFDVRSLIARGKAKPPASITGCVDERSVGEILAEQNKNPEDKAKDDIQIWRAPPGYYVQEPRFVPSKSYSDIDDNEEDAGYLLTYVFDESQLLPNGDAPTTAFSELWIVDAKGMRDVLCKVRLPQRVPYGLHGSWFPEKEVSGQREVVSTRKRECLDGQGWKEKTGKKLITGIVRAIGG